MPPNSAELKARLPKLTLAIANLNVWVRLLFAVGLASAATWGADIWYRRTQQIRFGRVGTGIMLALLWTVLFSYWMFAPGRFGR